MVDDVPLDFRWSGNAEFDPVRHGVEIGDDMEPGPSPQISQNSCCGFAEGRVCVVGLAFGGGQCVLTQPASKRLRPPSNHGLALRLATKSYEICGLARIRTASVNESHGNDLPPQLHNGTAPRPRHKQR